MSCKSTYFMMDFSLISIHSYLKISQFGRIVQPRMPHNPLHHDEVVVLMFQNLARGEVRPEGPNVPKSDPDQTETQGTGQATSDRRCKMWQIKQIHLCYFFQDNAQIGTGTVSTVSSVVSGLR